MAPSSSNIELLERDGTVEPPVLWVGFLGRVGGALLPFLCVTKDE